MASGVTTLAFLQNIGMPEMIVIGIVEFKKGLKETEDDLKTDVRRIDNEPARKADTPANSSSGH